MGKAAKIPHTELDDVRHSYLGMSLELLEDELPALEELHKRLQDTDAKAALAIRMVLESIDSVLDCYKEVR